MHSNGVIVNDTAKKHGGEQNIILSCKEGKVSVPLEFDGDIMKLKLRMPTEEELMTLGVIWLRPAINKTLPKPIQCRRFETMESVEGNVVQDNSKINQDRRVTFSEETNFQHWRQLLAYPSEDVVKHTLQSTTQYCVEPIEMELRDIPRQHRKKRISPLHPRRLGGRVDTDTFFSSVKSVRGYKCIQLFVHVESDFIFVRCMQRESHSHGAYQDFIREVGAPQMIVSDNAKTQTGKKWEATSQSYLIKQRRFAPYNQNQNKAERRIQDVKHKVMMVLDRGRAPLKFWCYCLIFVVDCLNIIAKKPLDWRTSSEILNGDTPDISAFRFYFWQPIEYFDPTAKFPDALWKPGRFIGIAWDSGDQFTYKVWTEPDWKWQDGVELVRNILRPRGKYLVYRREIMNGSANLDEFKIQKRVVDKK